MEQFIKEFTNNKLILVLGVFILCDAFFGCLRAIKERKLNSSIGINGLLRKVGIIGSVFFLLLVDSIFKINLMHFIPEKITNVIGDIECGFAVLFTIIYILFEITSVLKNMRKCGLPIPKKLKGVIDKFLIEFTTELENKK